MVTTSSHWCHHVVRPFGVLLLIINVLAGCAPTLNLKEQAALTDVNRLVDAAARQTHSIRPYVSVTEEQDRAGASYNHGNLYIAKRSLDIPPEVLEALVAHELGHYALRHEPLRYLTTEREIFDQQSKRELDANAEAVKILMAAKGIDEAAAVRQMHAMLWRLVVQKWPPARNHMPWCAEIDDLMRRFPKVAMRSCEPGA